MNNRTEINKIIFPSTLKKIGNSAFKYLYLDSVEFNNGLEIIGDEAFYDSDGKPTKVIIDGVPYEDQQMLSQFS